MVLLAAILSGCGEEPQEDPVLTAPTIVTQDDELTKDWLKREDNVDPAQWMAEKEAANDPAYDKEAATAEIRELLDRANENFVESARMIANRAVQLQNTLASKGINERARDIIVKLNSIKNPSIQSARFGALCQYYSTLREQGMSSDDALNTLSRHDASQMH
ncbi:hypothetical protein CAP48_08815 [Advenella sp. S44]|nr:hypothetical protein CAP48_08815 [Advenella sp. S44]